MVTHETLQSMHRNIMFEMSCINPFVDDELLPSDPKVPLAVPTKPEVVWAVLHDQPKHTFRTSYVKTL